MTSAKHRSIADDSTCVIVGGGVLGLSTAWELSRRGLRCQLLDQGQVGRSSSWAGAGILPPARADTALDPIDRLRGLSHELHPQWATQLQQITGVDTGFRKCGGVYVARSAGEAALLVGLAQYWSEYQLECRFLSPAALAEVEPNLHAVSAAHEFRCALWAPDEAQLRPPHHLRALKIACELSGVQIQTDCVVNQLEEVGNRIVSVSGGGRTWKADHVVLTCGAWAGRFADPRGAIENVYPVRGQVVLYQGPPGFFRAVINEGNRYFVPRDDGLLYVGSNEEEVGLSEGDNPAAIQELRQWAESLVPAVKDFPVLRTWSGLRPGSFDGFPYIGRSPELKNLYLATGHFRSGLHLSCGTAVVLADLITEQPTPMDISPFRISR